MAPIVLYHHEWVNGQGYPEGLVGEEIPLGARMAKVAQWIHDAITGRDNPAAVAKVRKEVKALCLKHPMYTDRLRA